MSIHSEKIKDENNKLDDRGKYSESIFFWLRPGRTAAFVILLTPLVFSFFGIWEALITALISLVFLVYYVKSYKKIYKEPLETYLFKKYVLKKETGDKFNFSKLTTETNSLFGLPFQLYGSGIVFLMISTIFFADIQLELSRSIIFSTLFSTAAFLIIAAYALAKRFNWILYFFPVSMISLLLSAELLGFLMTGDYVFGSIFMLMVLAPAVLWTHILYKNKEKFN